MKNQYFGDTRDLFKYDLVLELLLRSNLSCFTFIPMLTKDEPSTYGGKIDHSRARAGARRAILRKFLERCIKEGRRSMKELEEFFKNSELPKTVNLTVYKKNSYFSDSHREEYFSRVTKRLLTKSVILVDPDIGLEVKSMKGRGEKYIRYEEVKLLYDCMDNHSILLIFQFIPRVKRERYFSIISKRLKQKIVGKPPIYYVSDNQVVFFILTKDLRLQKSLEDMVYTYAHFYGLLCNI